jgi:hypothetical protein
MHNAKLNISLFCILLLMSSFSYAPTGVFMTEPEIPNEVARKFKRDAARLALRLQMQNENLRYMPIPIQGNNTEKIYKTLCQIYLQTDQAKNLEKCNIHTYPDPSIDHLVIIYQKSADWAAPLQNGSMQTNSQEFNSLVTKYKLSLEKHVLWTEGQNAVTLRAKEPLNMLALAEEFTQIEGVQGFDLGIPKTKGNDITLRRNKDSWDVEYVLRFGAWAAGKGESHQWLFQVTDAGKVKLVGDSGNPIPSYLKCELERQSTR